MSSDFLPCIVCETPADRVPGLGEFARYECPRCGVFILNGGAEAVLPGMLNESNHRRSLMSFALRRMQRPNNTHLRILTKIDLPSFWEAQRLPNPQQQADALVVWIGDNQPDSFHFAGAHASLVAAYVGLPIARDGRTDTDTLKWLRLQIAHLNMFESIGPDESPAFRLTIEGASRYENLKKISPRSRTAFMAMKIGDETLDQVFADCFRPAAARTGFELRKLIEHQSPGLIDNHVRAAIVGCRFVIADVTHSSDGTYWEAGYAEGLGLPVIYTCEASVWQDKETQFDTNHTMTVVWDASNLKKAEHDLAATIRATLRAEAKQSD
jgi:hypothetical protein